MGIKEGTCDDHWVLYECVESLSSTPEATFTLYVNYVEFKEKLGEKKVKKYYQNKTSSSTEWAHCLYTRHHLLVIYLSVVSERNVSIHMTNCKEISVQTIYYCIWPLVMLLRLD